MLIPKYKDAQWEKNVSCEVCGSKDNKSVYNDGTTWCWTCQKRGTMEEGVQQEEVKPLDKSFVSGKCEDLVARKITEDTCQYYNYQKGYIGEESVQIANFMENGIVIAQKLRKKNKEFSWRGNTSMLFGQHCWQPNHKWEAPLIITEGELDCLSVAQAFNLKWPVVSITKGAGHAVNQIKDNLEYIESFPEVILCFDNDDAGHDAMVEVAHLIKPGKCKITTLPEKDASDLLRANRQQDLVNAIYNSTPFRPDGLVAGDEIWQEIIKTQNASSVPYPFERLNGLTHGIRCGEIVTITAGTGIGKSQFCREVAYHAMQKGEKVAYVALEENVKRSAIGLMSIHANKPLHLVDPENVNWEEWLGYYNELDLPNKAVFYNHWGSTTDQTLIPKLRYLVKGMDCNVIVLDHISIIISGDNEGDERRKIDNLMTNLRSFVEESQCAMLVVSHLKRLGNGRGHEDGGQVSLSHLRGSQAIAQMSDMVIGLERNQQGDDAHLTTIRVLKNRYSGELGESSRLRYNIDTGRMFEVLGEENEFFEQEQQSSTDF